MTDYGRALQFGAFVTPSVELLANTFELAALADETGLDLIGVQDHPYQAKFLDCWSLMGTLLARTERVRVFPDVACLPLRPPATMAKAAASLDLMSGGRFELALGAGAFWEAIGAMGGDVRTPGQAAAALEEAVEVIRLMWSGERAVYSEGEHYRLAGVHPGPVPAHRIGIWLGVGGPRLLRALGRSADGWVPSSSYFPP
ncbi:MAG: LLM class flavin-dependent oxidoreductase, partial [Rhodococcus sp. (in: high G+C Gram-positive bacteria)]